MKDTFELNYFASGLFRQLKARDPVNWDSVFEKIKNKKEEILRKIPPLIHYEEDHSFIGILDSKKVEKVRHNSLSKALCISLESDFISLYIEPIKMLQEMLENVMNILESKYEENKKYDILYLKVQILESLKLKFKGFLEKIDDEDNLMRHCEGLLMECIGMCEDFKTYWMEFFSSEIFFDIVDTGQFDFDKFSSIVFSRSQEQLKGYQCLHSVFKSQIFLRVQLRFRKFNQSLGRYLLDYFVEIGRDTQAQLKLLDSALKQSKLLTNHIVVSSVAGLRFSLQRENITNLKKLTYLMHIDKRVLHPFWKKAVLNFDKNFLLDLPNDLERSDQMRVSEIALVERESDKRLGILVYLKKSMERYVMHKGEDGRLFVVNSTKISNRYACGKITGGS